MCREPIQHSSLSFAYQASLQQHRRSEEHPPSPTANHDKERYGNDGCSSDGRSRSARQVVADRISSGLRSLSHVLSDLRSLTGGRSQGSPPRSLGVDTEALTHQVISQFGQMVESTDKTSMLVPKKRRDTEVLTVRWCPHRGSCVRQSMCGYRRVGIEGNMSCL